MATGAQRSKTYRVVTAAFGLLFAVVAAVIVVVSDRSLGPMLAAAVIGILGIEMIVSALRNRLSLLSRIGPLP